LLVVAVLLEVLVRVIKAMQVVLDDLHQLLAQQAEAALVQLVVMVMIVVVLKMVVMVEADLQLI
jgi:hypothetical protein